MSLLTLVRISPSRLHRTPLLTHDHGTQPATSWRLYGKHHAAIRSAVLLPSSSPADAERYIDLPGEPRRVHDGVNVERDGLPHVDFLFARGSGDDSVHYANSAHLLNMFTADQMRGFRFRMFSDRCALLWKWSTSVCVAVLPVVEL